MIAHTPCFFDRAIRSFATSKTGALPIHGKLAVVSRPPESCIKASSAENGVWNVSVGIQKMANGLQQISGITSPTTSSFVDAVAASGALMGAAGMNENHKAYKQARDIHDITGQKLAALGGLEMGMFAMGSTADAATRVFSAVQEVGLAIHNPVVFGAAAATAVAVLTLAGTLLYGLFYLFCAVRLVSLGASWVRGRAWRQELSKEHRPVEALFRQLKERLNKIDVKDAAEIGIKAGAKWLAKVEKESGGKLNIPDKEAAFQKLIQKHPDILEGLIGQSQSPGELLERFGQYIAYQQECAKFEAECARKLGSKAVEAMRAGSNEELSKALESRNWKGLAAKIGLAVVGFSLMTIGIMVFFGSPTGVLLVLAGVLTVALGIFGDGIALVAQARKGEFTKHDWKYIYTTFFLSLASFVGVVALTIATGGIGALAVSLVLSSLWLCVNTLNAYRVWRYENRRWEVQSVIDLVTYRKFLETKPSQEKILEVKQKLSRKDLRYVKRLGDDVLRRLRAKEAQAEGLRRGQLGELVSKIESIL